MEKETLLRKMAFFTKITERKDHRSKLEDSKACLFCGAKEHSFAKSNVPVPDETEKKIETFSKLIMNAEKQKTDIKKLEIAEKESQKNLTASEKLKATATTEKKLLKKTFPS